MPIHYDTKHPWIILLQLSGSIWISVLPYCILNCCITYGIYYAKSSHDVHLTFSASGHALMSLLVSYLVVSKVYLSLDRYMHTRTYTGQTLTTLRELNQLVLTFSAIATTTTNSMMDDNNDDEKDDDVDENNIKTERQLWQKQASDKIVQLVKSTIHVVRNENLSAYLARNEPIILDDNNNDDDDDNNPPTTTTGKQQERSALRDVDDPMVLAHLLRLHLYNMSADLEMQLLERTKLVDHLNLYLYSYREILKLASTPLPFTMIQMGRTFLFLWTFTMPFALVGVVDEVLSVMVFVFFLTYGFIGLEFVSMQLLHPFGDDGMNDINILGMGQAVLVGMEKDARQQQSWQQQQQQQRRVPSTRSAKLRGSGSSSRRRLMGDSRRNNDSSYSLGMVHSIDSGGAYQNCPV